MAFVTRRSLLFGGGLYATSAPWISPRDAELGGGGPVVLGSPKPDTRFEIAGRGEDVTDLWKDALARIQAAGYGSIRAVGEHRISSELVLPRVTRLEIVGDDCLLIKERPGEQFPIFSGSATSVDDAHLLIANLTLKGDWEAVSSLATSNSRGISAHSYCKIRFEDLHLSDFRQMSLTASDADEVYAVRCTIERSARDAINLSGCRFVSVTSCIVRHCGDDAIANHVRRDISDATSKYATIISGNHIADANGIKVLGGENIIISNNNIMRPKNYGIYMGKDERFKEGNVPHNNVVIQGNVITDVIGPEYLVNKGDVNTAILFSDHGRPISNTLIYGNVVTKTKPSGAGIKYSDWGYGPMYTPDGWYDPPLTNGHVGRGRGIRVVSSNADDTSEIVIENNLISNFDPTSAVVRQRR